MTFTPASKVVARFKVLDLKWVRAGRTATRQVKSRPSLTANEAIYLAKLSNELLFEFQKTTDLVGPRRLSGVNVLSACHQDGK